MRSSKVKASWFKRQKCFVGFLLRHVLESPWRQRALERKLNITEQELDNYGRRIQSLLEAMEEFEASNTHQENHQDLAVLVHKISRFKQSTPLRDLLANLTDMEMPAASRDRLLTCLDKIARYHEIAKFLCQEARTMPILQNATVKSLELPVEAFARSTGTVYNGTVSSVLDRMSTKEIPIQKYNLPPWLQTRLEKMKDSDTTFAAEIKKALRESKIHAEIQILAHYEGADPAVLRPRVIASSKDACYLCHTLISLHGQYHIPKTHGRLYRAWRLPTIRTFNPLQQRLNAFLEQQVRATVGRLLEMEGLPRVTYPNESTLFPLTVSASLLSSMRNLSMVLSNHSRLDLTTTARDVDGPSQAPCRAPEASINGASLRHSPRTADCDPGPYAVDPGSDIDKDSQGIDSIASKSVGENDSVNTMVNGTLSFADRAAEPSNLKSQASSSSADNKAAETARSPSEVGKRGDRAIMSDSASANKDWFCYKNLNIFIDESSARFSHTRLRTSEAVEVLRGNADTVFDVRSLAFGAEINLSKSLDGNTYFACGDEAVMLNTHHR